VTSGCRSGTALAAVVAAATLWRANAAAAEPIDFGPDLREAGWTVVSFPGIAPAAFKASSRETLSVVADSAAGLLWRTASVAEARAGTARWRWRVAEGAPATDLTRRGADDRALALYFVFGAAADHGKPPLALLGSSSVTALAYVFGGNSPRGVVLPSPHMGKRGKFIVLRDARARKGVWFEERLDIRADYQRAFGKAALLLLAVAISSDCDDTRTRNRADVSALALGEADRPESPKRRSTPSEPRRSPSQ